MILHFYRISLHAARYHSDPLSLHTLFGVLFILPFNMAYAPKEIKKIYPEIFVRVLLEKIISRRFRNKWECVTKMKYKQTC